MTEICSICKEKIDWHEWPVKQINGKYTCKKCYYEKLGEIVDKHPIGFPGGVK